ncbi:MAG TPA: DUF1552 domain-containing protein [Polyangia bacterium]|nr:DUF1552 domain-containing protein [Polyangia bacterium]
MKVLDRRTLLRGAGGIAMALPFLDAMSGRRRARAAGVAKRFISLFSANGTIMNNWAPTGTETAYTLSPILAPLAAHQDHLLVLRGLANEVSYNTPGSNPHDLAMGTLMTAMPMTLGPSGLGRADHIIDGTVGGPSIDQVIANNIGAGQRFSSLSLGVQSTSTILEPMVIRMSYRGPGDPIVPQDDPGKAFTMLFGDTQASQAAVLATQKRRGTVLDAVLADLTKLSATVSAADKIKLDAHATSIRELEKQLLTVGDTMSSCRGVTPAAPMVSLTPYNCVQDARPATCVGDFATISAAQIQILTLALACDLTRVATLQWSTAESTVVHSELAITGEHHLMSHDDTDDAPQLTRINTWYAGQLAMLLDQLSTITDADGQTLLDGSVVFWANELSAGSTHDRRDLPWVLAGKGNGTLRPGRYVHNGGDPHNKLFAAFLNMFGVPATSFGAVAYPGVLSGLS